ncbi:substrate-binding domain-containing protein [Herbaspirillum sp. RTI4]|uniref:substrate-binding domain-containing protein n=1 Tax=Herbaspirillum sp. RTI4 TaxID=3048640 RepID=UPI002AB445B8|nr:substrate-binding domain-containing protein [Herbaspirillum sp. RTI4]MDY7579849.1 substrate-binding domain-containing protein [Herbaspirillum sp. RTI4]MEA9981936.1 substrate-binding domain-containing protein [Herbaspirillum sp. RTI4]
MYKVIIKPHWEITHDTQTPLDTAELLLLLGAIQQTGSIAQAALQLHSSYRHAWGVLRSAETLFGCSLTDSGRGRGTTLTPFADKLLWADRLVAARLSPTLDSLASELETELDKTVEGASRAVRLFASHGFAVAALLRQLKAIEMPVEVRYRHSSDAIAALSRQECDLAGFSIPLGELEAPAVAHYASWLNKRSDCLIHLAERSQGLFVMPGNPKNITSLEALAHSGVRFVNRETGSGTRMLLEMMLARASISPNDISGFENTEFTHSAVAAFIASGMADVGFGVQTAAQRFGLEFIPLIKERYFFALRGTTLNDPLMRVIVDILQSTQFRQVVDELAGYDGSKTGKILTLQQAFG